MLGIFIIKILYYDYEEKIKKQYTVTDLFFFANQTQVSYENLLNVDHQRLKISNVVHLLEKVDDPWCKCYFFLSYVLYTTMHLS